MDLLTSPNGKSCHVRIYNPENKTQLNTLQHANRLKMNENKLACPFECKVVDNIAIAEGVHYLSFERPFEFESGEVISLTTDFTITPRLYSIASGTNEPTLSILFDVKPDGLLTNKLRTLAKGDTVNISKPYGSFKGTTEPAIWIATGSGVAPFISMAKSGFAGRKMLIQGARNLEGFYFHQLFEDLPAFTYIRCCSQQSKEGIYAGRLTAYLKDATDLPIEEKYYLCGNPLMVNEVRELLIEKGVPYDNILSEIFF